jgi:hypothetical protein
MPRLKTIPKQKHARVFHFRASADLYVEIQRAAAVLGLQPSTFARMAVSEKVAQIKALTSPPAPAAPSAQEDV